MDEPVSPPSGTSVRLIFEYEGDEVRLVSQQVVDVAVTGFDLPQEHAAGHLLEVRSATEEPLSQVAVREAMSTSAEVFPEEHGAEITRVDLPEARGAFTVVVPVAAGADHVTLLRVPPAPAGRALGAQDEAGPPPASLEIGSFPLETRGDGQ